MALLYRVIKPMNQKGNYSTGAVGVMTTMIVGVAIAVMLLVFVGSLGGQTYNLVEDDMNDIGNHVVTSETFTTLNGTAVSLAHPYIQSGTLKINNVTPTKVAILLANFTIDYTSGTLLLDSELGNNNTVMSVNYTYGLIAIQNSAKGGILSSFEALEQTGGYLPIIVLAVVITLVMMLVLGLGNFTSNGKGGMAL